MLVALSIAWVLAVPSPAPAEPLKTIGHVKTRALCSAMRERLGPSIAALLQNDATIHDGTQQLFYMDRDGGTQWLEMDKLRLENDVEEIVRNLDVTYKLIEVATAEEAKAEGTDRETIERLKDKLRAVADSQRAELNTLDGRLESEQAAQLSGADAGLSTQPSDPHLTPLAGRPSAVKSTAATGYDLSKITPNQIAMSAKDGGFTGHLGGSGLAGILGIRATKKVESDFALQFTPLVAECQESPPTP